jgi:hypothetical protein
MSKVLGILKRNDLDFSFPIELDLKPILKLKHPDDYDLTKHMGKLGYDYAKAQESIIENSFETQIDKDFNKFSGLIHDIVKFLEDIRDLPPVSGVSEKKIGNFLKDRIDDPSDLIGMRKKRKKIITICVEHNYFDVDFNSGFDNSSNTKKLFKISKKAITAIQEFREGIPQKRVTSYEKRIDENGDEIGEISDQNEGVELGRFDNSKDEHETFDYDDEMDTEDIPEDFRPIFEMRRS